ncbi:hypothetical protein FA13DRAFT_1760634 [Coprinellus micaceus]|uniref:PH domain-containing protein n=1 Tax=Coprinellus micaceus TaxID=71717 RepID=A0A4Y7U1N5_COPMI|nr:hypothetical protein FA13DRAFT_1760634 [Coprinellus micaceus]
MSGGTGPERIWSHDGEATAFTTVPYPSTPAGGFSVPSSSSRPATPSIFARRRNSTSANTRSADIMFTSRNRLSMSQTSKSSDKGKAPMRRDSPGNGEDSMNSHPFATYDRVVSNSNAASSSSHDSNPRKNRSSLFAVRQAPVAVVLPDVIEISAPPPDQEVEERERLREMAAQAIGISPLIVRGGDTHSQEESTEDEDDDALRTPADTAELSRFGDTRNSESTPDVRNKSWLETSSINTTTTPMRFRSGSVASHSRQNSIVVTPAPSFPTNVLSLNPFLACSAYFPKYTQPSSLRRLALSSKNWKTRYIVLSAPSNPISRNPASNVSYIHVFKSSGPDDKELERLQIHTDSAVFVADEDVGGRGNVVRIKGFEIKWISAIKSAILGQRTLAAGLVIPTTPTGAEPRGDLDVIMKIRTQGLASATPASPTYDTTIVPKSPTERNYASSISSQSVQSHTTTPKQPTATSATVSALKTLFTTRPRSGSRATSLSVGTERQMTEHEHTEESFASMGNNLLGRLRSSTPDSSTLNTPVGQRNVVPFTFHTTPSDRIAERRLHADRQAEQWAEQSHAVNRQNRSLSVGALSLQPPPRKRWASLLPPNSERTSRRMRIQPSQCRTQTEPPSSPLDSTTFPMHAYDQRPRAPSLQSVSTFGSEITKRSSTSTRRSSGTNKRWSRQLPQRQAPPSGPPPTIPAAASLTQLNIIHSPKPERPPSVASSQHSAVLRLPSFSKRASTSSSYSIQSSSTKNSSSSSSRPQSSRRTSLPPLQGPPPTSALPPAPDQTSAAPAPPAPAKSSFRNSMTQRAMRFSIIAPKPPPASSLPARPDENTTGTPSSSAKSQVLETIIEPSKTYFSEISVTTPLPPPSGPLPPTPATGELTPTPQTSTPAVSRHTSLKQRFRGLSAPPPIGSSSVADHPASSLSSSLNSRPTASTTTTPIATPILMQFNAQSTPSTPTADRTTMNDSSFLNTTTPTMNSFLASRMTEQHHHYNPSNGFSHEMVEVLDHVTPLSPPPRSRRRSTQIVTSFESREVQEQRPALAIVTPAPLSPESPSPVSLTRSNSIFDDQDDSDHIEDEYDYLHDDSLSDDLDSVPDALDRVLSRRGKATTRENPVDPANAFSKPPHGSVVSLGHVNL